MAIRLPSRRTTCASGAALAIALIASVACAAPAEQSSLDAESLHAALERLASQHSFSGAVVVHRAGGVRFARGYGLADPFSGRFFTPDTPVDSASLAKPVTAAAVLLLVNEGKVELDAPVRSYLPGYPHVGATVRHLLAHSAGLPQEEALETFANKTNEQLMNEIAERRLPPLFEPGKGFAYCNFCYTTLALLIERITGEPYLSVVQQRAGLPAGVSIRPLRLADWPDRAIGYRRTPDGKIERADSYEDEAFYGTANFSISAVQLAQWGAQWWQPRLAGIRKPATTPARIDGKPSGLTLGNWYCSPEGARCHYLGHHEGFHHMVYWDAGSRTSIAMVSNNTLAPGYQQRLQRALVAFSQARTSDGLQELKAALPDEPPQPGRYRLGAGELATLSSVDRRVTVERRGVQYPAYRIGAGLRYVPGLDTYLAGVGGGAMHWLNLYEDFLAEKQ